MATVAPAAITVDAAITTTPVDGWVQADYNIIIMGSQVRYLLKFKRGRM